MSNLFSTNGNTLKVGASHDYDAGITQQIDQQIRHMNVVVRECMRRAGTLHLSVGSNFEIVIQDHPDTARPRVYVVPKNHRGIREELTDAVLLKAALGMAGK